MSGAATVLYWLCAIVLIGIAILLWRLGARAADPEIEWQLRTDPLERRRAAPKSKGRRPAPPLTAAGLVPRAMFPPPVPPERSAEGAKSKGREPEPRP